MSQFFRTSRLVAAIALSCGSFVYAQLSTSAYRVLGQIGFQQNGLNMVQGMELNSPAGIAIDFRNGQLHVYVSDTGNHRILAWQDARSYQNGDPPALVLAQPGRQFSAPLGIGLKGLNSPLGMAVDPTTGNLYVADSNNNRVVRFPNPFANPARVEPDAVYGQPGFNVTSAGVSSSTLNKPRAVAFDSKGNLWVADTGNHRIVRFSAALLDSASPPAADAVIGQPDFFSNRPNAGGPVSASGFDTPAGLAFDSQDNLYVADLNNTRVLKFSAPLGPSNQNPAASSVWGEPNFQTRGVIGQPSASTIAAPAGLAVDAAGNLYVASPADNRVLIFPATNAGGAARSVLGQPDFSSTAANANASPKASPNTLSNPRDVKVDPASGIVFVADSGNNRVVSFPPGSKSATQVWGQTDFIANSVNQLKPASIGAPYKMAIDYSSAPYALYVSDFMNNRVLAWRDSVRFRNGDPADFVIGQPDLFTGIPNVDTRGSQTPSRTSLSGPAGIAVNPSDGSLYVADSGNNRVLHYPRPVSQVGRITPDAVIGQTDFNSNASALVNSSSLKSPMGVALGPDGNIFIADTGNNRVLEFAAGAGTGATAIRVYGQPNSTSASAPAQPSAQTLAAPQGLFVDQSYNLYVADTAANRVVIFPNTQSAPPAGATAAFVIGQSSFNTAASGTLKTPTDVAVDSGANIYVADYGDNRILIFPSVVFLPVAGAEPAAVVGQQDTKGTTANWSSTNGLAASDGLFGPIGIYLDRQDTLYVGDSGNSRVLHFLKAAFPVNSATYQAAVPVSQGGLTTLFGNGFTTEIATAAGASWPTSLANREVVINDEIKAPIYFINSTQVNFQMPQSAPLGSDRIALRIADTGELIAGGSLPIAAVSPGLFTATRDGKGQAAATNQDGRINSSANPAARGSIITLYGTGQGRVSPPVPDGVAAPSSPLSNTVTVPTSDARACIASQPSMCVAIGSSFAEIQYSGLAPGYIGLWQINVKIPQEVPPGNATPVRILLNGVPSNTVTVAIR
jgi:uncharacterized protein (TIGR03437 family)